VLIDQIIEGFAKQGIKRLFFDIITLIVNIKSECALSESGTHAYRQYCEDDN